MGICRGCNPEVQAWTGHDVQQNATSLTYTTDMAWFLEYRGLVIVEFKFDIASAGTVGTELLVAELGNLPLPYASATERAVGSFYYLRTGASAERAGVALLGTQLRFAVDNNTGYLGATPSFAAASGDVLSGAFRYRRA